MRVILVVAVVALVAVCAPPVQADIFLSYAVEAGDYGPHFVGGVGVKVQDLFNFTAGTIAVTVPGAAADLDAAHVLADGKILLSARTDVFGFGATSLNFSGGDLVIYDPATNTADFVLRESVLFGDPISSGNIDAVYKFESGPNTGKYLLSTSADAVIDGTLYRARDLVLYDPTALKKTSLFLDGDVISGTIDGRNINSVHVLGSGNIVLSTFSSGGTLGGLSPHRNFIEYNPVTGAASLYLGGEIFSDIKPRVFDALSITYDATGNRQGPEPTTFVLAGFALLVALSVRHRL